MKFFRSSAAPVLPDGASAERMAERWLLRQGLRLVTRNYSCRQGEIDLVMEDNQSLVFVEVRFRKSSAYGSAAETVTPAKQRKITLAAQDYLQRHPKFGDRPARFDVLAISPTPARAYHYNWLRHAFDGAF